MSPRVALLTILCAVTLITVIVSHSMTSWLRIETAPGGYWVIGPGEGKASVFMAGSSLARDGLSWQLIASRLNHRIEGWGLAGSSPPEWERFQYLEAHTKLTILVVSLYDLNEYFLSDYRAHVVPLTQTIEDLWQTHLDWTFHKRVLSMYPLTYLRTLFPTAGRSTGVIRGLREKAETYVKPLGPMEDEETPTLSFNDFKKDKITDWSQGMMLRRLVAMRIACQGRHVFNGPKRLAFLRMLHRAQEQGSVVVVVLPVSSAYAKEFLTAEVQQRFEEDVAEVRHSVERAHWVRLDQLNGLSSNQYFQDLVHMNSYGQNIASEALLGRLGEFTTLP